jgi:uncharacterized protein (TIGR02594 family)
MKTKVNLNASRRVKHAGPNRSPVKSTRVRREAPGAEAKPRIADNDNVSADAPDSAPARAVASFYNHAVLASAVAVLTLLSAATVWSALASPPRFANEQVTRIIDAQVGTSRLAADDAPLIAGAFAPMPSMTLPPLAPGLQGVSPAKRKTLTRAERREMAAHERAERLRARQVASARRTYHRAALAGLPGGSSLIAEARRYLGRNPTGWAHDWCGKFLDMVLRRTGYRGGGNLALAYARYGHRLPGPQVGAIAVFTRRGGGHVGIVTGIDSNGNPVVISGNYNHRVAETTFPARLAVAYVSPGPVD